MSPALSSAAVWGVKRSGAAPPRIGFAFQAPDGHGAEADRHTTLGMPMHPPRVWRIPETPGEPQTRPLIDKAARASATRQLPTAAQTS